MWSIWSRALVGALLVALGTSFEFDDQLPATEDVLYLDDNYIDTSPSEVVQLPMLSDVMTRKLINAMQFQRFADGRLSNWPHPSPLEEVERRIEHAPDTRLYKDPVFKRLVEAPAGSAPAHHLPGPVKPQKKWKIKKGKSVGSQIVCYFKLCAFRYPN